MPLQPPIAEIAPVRSVWVFVLILCGSLTSCTPFVHYSEKALDPAARAKVLTDRRLEARPWALSELIADATAHHPDIAVARARYDAAVAAIRTAGERPNPTVSLSPQIITPYTALIAGTYGVDFDWTFETAGKRNRRLDLAQVRTRTAAAEVVTAIWTVRGGVRRALLDLYAAEERTALLTSAISKQGALLKALDERVAAGAESRQISSQARLLQAQLRIQAAETGRLASDARAALAESMAISVAGLSGLTFTYNAFRETPSTLPDRQCALTRRADILAALADYAAAEATLRLEVAGQYPDLHLNPGYSLDAGENKWTLGIGLTLPILNHNEGAIGEAEAKRQETAAVFDSVQSRVLADYERSTLAYRAARVTAGSTETLLAEQIAQMDSEKRLLDAGAGDRTTLLSLEVERATTLTARLDAQIEVQSALGAIEEATQTPAL